MNRCLLLLSIFATAAPTADFPRPPAPSDNPMSEAKVAACHRQELAFTEGRTHAVGTTGEVHPRSSMSLVNVAYAPRLTTELRWI